MVTVIAEVLRGELVYRSNLRDDDLCGKGIKMDLPNRKK